MSSNSSFYCTAEQMVMSYAVKYNRLSGIIQELYGNSKYSKANQLHLFINLTDIFKSISSNAGCQKNASSISAAILNLCAHYRSFFRNGYSTEIKIFLIRSLEVYPHNMKFHPEYGKKNNLQMELDNSINEACGLLEVICPYLYDIQIITTPHEFSVMALDIATYYNLDIPHLVLTKDITAFQLVFPDLKFTILRPLKSKGEDLSYYVNANNLISTYYNIRKIDSKPRIIEPSYYSILLSMTKLPERNLRSLISIRDAVKILDALISKVGHFNISTDPFTIIPDDILRDAFGKNASKIYEISCRYKAIDLYKLYHAYSFNEMVKYNGMINLTDPNGINEISNKYYKKYPVDFLTLI